MMMMMTDDVLYTAEWFTVDSNKRDQQCFCTKTMKFNDFRHIFPVNDSLIAC